MLALLNEGGVPIYFVLIFGASALGGAALFAARGDRRRLAFIGATAVATLLSIAAAICADLAAVGHHAPQRCPAGEPLSTCLLTGFAESMAPGIVGFTLLSLAAMLAAVGLSRTSRA